MSGCAQTWSVPTTTSVTTVDIDLSGTWRAAPTNDELRRTYQDDAFDDAAWTPTTVPGHWQRTAEFATNQSPILYRTRFDLASAGGSSASPGSDAGAFGAASEDAGLRRWLTFDGIFYQSDVWLDGAYLGDTEGYFFEHSFEVTEALASRSEHLLAIEVNCAPQTQRNRKRNITGVFQHWNAVDPAYNPGGIWRPVRITTTGPVRLRHHRVTCLDASPEAATVGIRCILDSAVVGTATIRTTVAGVVLEAPHQLTIGRSEAEWNVTVPQPELWWPHALGDQPLHDVLIEVVDEHGVVSDSLTRRIGFRSIRMRDWITTINGERLHLKGTNHGPTDYWLAEATAADHRRDLQLALDANLDLVRVHGHISHPDLYDAADEMGLLLWQDFPLQSRYHRSIRRQAARQAREAVNLLSHHPSVAIWCARNEPLSISGVGEQHSGPPSNRPATFTRAAFDQQLPTYNKSVIDRAVSRTIRRTDGSRPVIEHSGMMPTLPRLDGTDTHLYFGWYHGDERQLPRFAATMPRMVRFVSEFGAQSVPADGAFLERHRADSDWPHLNWTDLAERHAAQREFLERTVPPAAFPDFDAWALETRNYQAMVIRFQVETLRRLKYRPSGGFAQFFLADAAPGITHSLVSHGRHPKEAYEALRRACAPVIVVADRLPSHLHGNEGIALDLHVVNDLRVALTDADLTAVLSWPGDEQRYRFRGDVAADDVQRIGTLQFVVPEVDGELRLDLTLTHHGPNGDGEISTVSSSYCAHIFHAPHHH